MEPTRIFLVGLPRLREEIVTHLLEPEPDLALVGTQRSPAGLARKVKRSRADVVLIGQDDPTLIAELLCRCPRVAVLAVQEEAGETALYALRPERVLVGRLTPQQLAGTLRQAALTNSAWWER